MFISFDLTWRIAYLGNEVFFVLNNAFLQGYCCKYLIINLNLFSNKSL